MNKKKILEYVELVESEMGISKEILADALAESFKFAFAKKIEDEYRVDKRNFKASMKNKEGIKLPDALIRADVNLEKGKIKVFHQWLVVPEDEIKDDFIEIAYEEAKEKNAKIKLGDFYEEELDIDSMKDKDVGRFVATFKQRITKAEKNALLEAFQNKIGTNVNAEVEKCDKYSVIVNLLGKTSATLYRGDLIGDERFQSGDSIKVYVKGIGRDEKKGSLIQVSRSCPEFLRELFKTEIHEIYDGTVEIKKIARIPGKRSKVCVYSEDANVDASGACIGQNGKRIQDIVSILGAHTKDSKEKIDVITWSPNIGVFVSEILRPATMLGLIVEEATSTITAIVDDYNFGSAIGINGINIKLCTMLTGYENVNIIKESDANEQGLEYKTIEEYQAEAKEEEKRFYRERQAEKLEKIRKNRLAASGAEVESVEVSNEYVPEETNLNEEAADVEETVVETKATVEEKTPVVEEAVEVEEKPVEVVAPAPKKELPPEELRDVKTTTTLESLEKSLEEEKERKAQQAQAKKKKKAEKKVAKEQKEEKKNIVKMDIYTDEELAEFENEIEENYDYEEDYSEYDSDDYYEDR